MISVVIGTFGTAEWRNRGRSVAESLKTQTVQPASVHHIHGNTLAEARNRGAQDAEGSWLLFLDADDSIHPKFIENMESTIRSLNGGNFLIRPAIKLSDETGDPYVLPIKNIFEQNFMIIGTAVRKDVFLAAGMFREMPVLVDWDLWLRCFINGSEYASSPGSVYYITVNEGSRNKAPAHVQTRIAQTLRREHSKHRRRR